MLRPTERTIKREAKARYLGWWAIEEHEFRSNKETRVHQTGVKKIPDQTEALLATWYTNRGVAAAPLVSGFPPFYVFVCGRPCWLRPSETATTSPIAGHNTIHGSVRSSLFPYRSSTIRARNLDHHDARHAHARPLAPLSFRQRQSKELFFDG